MRSTYGETVGAGALVLRAMADTTLPGVSYDSLARAVEVTGWNRERPFIDNTWQDLISTGNLGLLSSQLRQELRSFYSDLARQDRWAFEHDEYLLAYREATGHLIDANHRLTLGESFLGQEGAVLEGDVDALRSRLRSTPSLGGRLADIILVNRGGELTHEDLVLKTEEILRLLDAELAAF